MISQTLKEIGVGVGKIFVGAMLVAGAISISAAATAEANYKRCVVCHGKSAEKVPPGGTITIISMASAEEIGSTMKKYRDDKTYGGKMKASMQMQMKTFKDEDIDALADYIVKNFKK